MAEARLVLSADIRQAQQQIRQFEQNLRQLGAVNERGQARGGILNRRDVEDFRRVTRDFQRDYDRYIGHIQQNARQLRELARGLRGNLQDQNLSNVERRRIEEQLRLTEAQRQMYQQYYHQIQQLQSQQQNVSGQIGGQANGAGLAGNLLGLNAGQGGFSGLTIAAVLGGLMKVSQKLEEGYKYYQQQMEATTNLAIKTGEYGSDFNKLQHTLQSAGYDQWGFSKDENQRAAETYTSKAGVTSFEKFAATDLQTLQQFATVQGMDLTRTSSAFGDFAKYGLFTEGGAQRFANVIGGVISSRGMRGREDEVVEGIRGLNETLAQTGIGVSESEMINTLGFQQAILEKNPAFKTQINGFTQAIQAGLSSGSPGMNLMLGWGAEYSGPQGAWELRHMREDGLKNPKTIQTLAKNLPKYIGNEYAQKEWIAEAFGLPADQAELMWQVIQDTNAGKYKSTAEIEKALEDAGKSDIQKKSEQWLKGDTLYQKKYESWKKNVMSETGAADDSIFGWLKEAAAGIDPSVSAGLGIAGAGITGMVTSAGLYALVSGMLPRLAAGSGLLPSLTGSASSIFSGLGTAASGIGTGITGLTSGAIGSILLPLIAGLGLGFAIPNAGDIADYNSMQKVEELRKQGYSDAQIQEYWLQQVETRQKGTLPPDDLVTGTNSTQVDLNVTFSGDVGNMSPENQRKLVEETTKVLEKTWQGKGVKPVSGTFGVNLTDLARIWDRDQR